jgi:hypothetical protein
MKPSAEANPPALAGDASGGQQITQGAEDAAIQVPDRFEHFLDGVPKVLCRLVP